MHLNYSANPFEKCKILNSKIFEILYLMILFARFGRDWHSYFGNFYEKFDTMHFNYFSFSPQETGVVIIPTLVSFALGCFVSCVNERGPIDYLILIQFDNFRYHIPYVNVVVIHLNIPKLSYPMIFVISRERSSNLS